MYMLRYKFREAADLQGGATDLQGGGGGANAAAPPKCGPDLSYKGQNHWYYIDTNVSFLHSVTSDCKPNTLGTKENVRFRYLQIWEALYTCTANILLDSRT